MVWAFGLIAVVVGLSAWQDVEFLIQVHVLMHNQIIII